MVNDINRSAPSSGSSDHNPSALHSDVHHHVFLWAMKFFPPSQCPAVLHLTPADLGPNSLMLTQQKKQTLRQANGGPGPEPARVDRQAGRGGSPSVSLSPSLC